jgi:sucrose phosphorylase
LNPAATQALVEQTLAHGGLISYQQNPGGTQSPYELNINYFDALSSPYEQEPIAMQINRFMAAYACMLCLQGLPGIYFHSMFGSRNWTEGVETSHNNRSINREKLEMAKLEAELANRNSLRSLIFAQFQRLLEQRAKSDAFNPQGGQNILDMGREVFVVLRSSPTSSRQMLCLQNVTAQKQFAGKIALEPYQVLWLEKP